MQFRENILKLMLVTFAFGILFPSVVHADPQWTLVWDDEFNGAANTAPDPTRWTYDLGGGGWGNGELETYTNSTANCYQDGAGHLVIKAIDSGGNYTSARIKSQGLFDQAYGRVEASIQLPQGGAGVWPAFWMLGENISGVGWPACGEIDMMENIAWPSNEIGGHLHGPVQPGGGDYNGGSGVGADYVLPSGSFNNSFHLFAAEWNPTSITFYVDGTAYDTLSAASLPAGGQWVFNHPFFILLNLAVGGVSGSPSGTPFPQQMLVDYVRVYKLTDNGTSAYGGTPASVPGTIQAENYDSYNDSADPSEPGEGFAYNAVHLSNTSGQYRPGDAVSVEACSDAGGGYDVDYTSPGQWLQYGINVTQAGTYDLTARVASSGQGGTFHFDLDGTPVTGELTAPNTGGWQNWQDVTAGGINLTAGAHELLLVEDSMGAGDQGVCNFNYFTLALQNPPTPTSTPTPVVSSTWRVNAGGPAYTDSQGQAWSADTNYTGGTAATSGSGISGTQDPTLYDTQRYGNSFSYTFGVPAGSYQVTLKFAETYSGDFASGDRVFNVSVNGAPALGSFDVYSQVGGNAADDQVINNVGPSGGFITLQFTGTSSADTNAVLEAIQIIPQPATTPPACPSGAGSFGNSAAGTGGYNLAGQLDCAQYTLNQAMTVTSMNLYMGSGTSGCGVVGVYSDNAGVPGSLLAQSGISALAPGWNSFSLPPTLLAAGKYWLSGSFSGNAVFDYSNGGGGTMRFETYAYTGGLPSGVGSTTGYGWLMSAYAGGCLRPTPTPTPTDTFTPTCLASDAFAGASFGSGAWTTADLGGAGPSSQSESGSLTVTTVSGDVWNAADSCRYLYQTISGDFDLSLRINSIPSTAFGKAGIMVRNSIDPASAQASAIACNRAAPGLPDFELDMRPSAGAADQDGAALNTYLCKAGQPDWVRLTRAGNSFTSYYSYDGANWTAYATQTLSLNQVCLVGLVVSGNSAGAVSADFNDFAVRSSSCTTPTATITPTSTASPTATASRTPSPTSTPSATPTASSSPSASATVTPSPTGTMSATATPGRSATRTPTTVFSATRTPSPDASPTVGAMSATATPSASMVASPVGTATASPTATTPFTGTATATPDDTTTGTSTSTATSMPTATGTVMAPVTVTPTPTPTASPSTASSPSPTATPSPSASATPVSGATVMGTDSPTPTLSPVETSPVSPCSGVPAWNGNFVRYAQGARVSYNGEIYQCRQAHTTEPNWTPPATPALWLDLGPCSGQAVQGVNLIVQALPAPNPDPRGVYVDLRGQADEIRVKAYSQAMTCVGRWDLPGAFQAGWNLVPLPAGWSAGLANGAYYLSLESGRQGQWRQAPAPLPVFLMR